MSNRTYDILKWIVQLFLPALGTLYFALASIWNFPYGKQIVGTITAVNAFIGVLLGISTAAYKKNNASALSNTEDSAASSDAGSQRQPPADA